MNESRVSRAWHCTRGTVDAVPLRREQIDEDWRDPPLLTEDELNGIASARRRRILPTLACAVFLPVAWAYFGLICVAYGIFVALVRARRTYEGFGKPSALGVETIATLVAIPLSGLAGTVGTSVAFYELSRPGAKGWTAGWDMLAGTILFALGVIVAFVWVIARHQSGSDPLPFEPDVDPRLGIDALRKMRTRPSGGFFGQGGFAAERVNETLRTGANAHQPTLWDAIASVLGGKHARIQLLALLAAAAGWVIFIVLIEGGWWSTLGRCCASIALLILAGGVVRLSAYYDQLRWARREFTLRQKRRLDCRASHEQRLVADDVLQKVDALSDEIRGLRILLENQGARKLPRGWLTAVMRRTAMKPRSRRRQ